MASREIPRDDWSRFLEAFGRRHRGSFVAVEEGAAVRPIPDRSLRKITADLPARGMSCLFLATGGSPEEFEVEAIPSPTRLLLIQDADGAEEGLEIDAAGGRTVLRLRSAVSCAMAGGFPG